MHEAQQNSLDEAYPAVHKAFYEHVEADDAQAYDGKEQKHLGVFDGQQALLLHPANK